jgi:uncharacterized protein (TIGR03118 family)
MQPRFIAHRTLTAIVVPGLVSLAVASGCGGDDDSSNTGTGGSTTAGRGGAAGKAGNAGRAGSSGAGGTTGGTSGRGGTGGGAATGGSIEVGGAAGATAEGGRGGTAGRGGTGGGIVAGEAGNAGNSEAGGGAGGEGGASEALGTVLNVVETKLTSDTSGATNVDSNLVNAWGLAINPISTGARFWVSAADKGLATVYDASGSVESTVVTIPPASGTGKGSPTGQVYNPTAADFSGDTFIFATEDGVIEGWQSGTAAVIRADRSAESASYKGLALVTNGATHRLAAANFHAGTVDVFDTSYARVTTTGLFVDPDLPTGYAPFNVAQLGSAVFVTYAKQDADKADDVSGAGNGYLSEFGADGSFSKRLISRGELDSPWGLALAPAGFGALAGTLLVGNFGNGEIHAYDLTTGLQTGTLVNAAGHALAIDGLWSIAFGPNTTAADLTSTLFFTAGPGDEAHGLFGKLTLP